MWWSLHDVTRRGSYCVRVWITFPSEDKVVVTKRDLLMTVILIIKIVYGFCDWNARAMWVQQDGVPYQFSHQMRNWLKNHFPGTWLVLGCLVVWLQRSPDMNTLSFPFSYGTASTKTIFIRKYRICEKPHSLVLIAVTDISGQPRWLFHFRHAIGHGYEACVLAGKVTWVVVEKCVELLASPRCTIRYKVLNAM